MHYLRIFSVILLFVFLGRALSLPGSQEGVELYIHDSNWEVFTEKPDVWSKATSQVFFSLGITFGIMTGACVRSLLRVHCSMITNIYLLFFGIMTA